MFKVGDKVTCKENIRREELTGVIIEVDYTDDLLHYYVNLEDGRYTWLTQDEVIGLTDELNTDYKNLYYEARAESAKLNDLLEQNNDYKQMYNKLKAEYDELNINYGYVHDELNRKTTECNELYDELDTLNGLLDKKAILKFLNS